MRSVVQRVEEIKKQLDNLMYVRDCPEDVIEDLKFVIESFFSLRELLNQVAAQNAAFVVEADLDKKMEIENPPKK